jgi:hypothetical protein
MNKYANRIPLSVLRRINSAILLVGFCAFIGLILLIVTDVSRLVTQMPWYFWPILAVVFLVILYKPPAPLQNQLGEIYAGYPWISVGLAVFVVLALVFKCDYSMLSGAQLAIIAIALASGVRAVQELLRRR